jgi:PAS domain S-box-containing protein
MGRDAAIAVTLLGEAGLVAKAVADPAQLTKALDEGAAAVLVAEEAIAMTGHEPLAAWLERQPAWSDLPIILLTHHGGGPERNPDAARLAALLGNVTFLERPFHPTTLVSVASTALRGRRRQYETRAHLEEVGEAEARLRVALKAGRLGSWILDLATTELSCTERCKAIFGRAPEEPFTYAELRRSVPADDRAAMDEAVAGAVATGADYEAEHRVHWPDGSVHWVEMRARVARGAEGGAAQLIGVALDTTERKRVEQVLETRVAERTADLAASERRFRAVFDSAFQMAVLTQLDGRVVLANRTALDMIGRSLADVIGLPIWETPWWAATPREARRLSGEFPRAAAGEFVRYEAELRLQPNDARVLDFSLKPVLDDVGAVVQVVAEGRDVTDLKRTEASLRQSQKLESIGQLTGGVAHDFNNLLMAVVANLDIVQRRVRGDPKLLRLVEGAIQGAQRGAALTQRLLAFARRQDLQPQVVDVPGLVLGMQRLLEQSLGPQIRIAIEDVRLSPVLVDPNQLELAVLNLALNARDAMPDGGTITIRFDELEVAATTAGLEPGAYLRLRVTDTGDGMDEATLRRAVEPFFSTKGIGKGTGLGLSMIHGLAVQSGGALRLASQPGSGTTAELLLPLTSAVIEPTEQSDPREPEMTSATILVVDDDALVAMSTAMMLEDLGHQVIEANSGQDALDVLKQARAVDLLLTDHAMPGMTGMELAQRARTLRPELPILLTTGYAELPGGAGIPLPRLTKPYQQAQLAAELAKLLPLQAR